MVVLLLSYTLKPDVFVIWHLYEIPTELNHVFSCVTGLLY